MMDFELGEEQILIRDSIELFAARHYLPSQRLAQLRAGPEASAKRWRELADLGWLTLGAASVSADNDGYIMTLMESFGRHLMLEPYVTRCVLVPALLETITTAAADSLRTDIAEGRGFGALALGDGDAGFDWRSVATRAAPTPEGYRLTGVKRHVEDGADADWFIVPANHGGDSADRRGVSLFLVHRDAPGLAVERFRSIDGHRHARLHLDGVHIEAAALLGAPGEGLTRLEAAIDRAIVAHLAEALGSMDAVRAVTLDYLKTRQQFGTTIGSFQVLQHRMVDIDTACEEARSMVYFATANLHTEPSTRRQAISAAKARVGQCGLSVARQCVQLHGGLGVSAELIVSHHLKRQMMLDVAYGNSAYHRARFAEARDLAA